MEISSIVLQDLEDKPNLMENVQHLSKGIIASTQTFYNILDKKLKYLNPHSIHFKCLKKLLQAAEDVSASSLQLAKPFEKSLEQFQEKTAGFLELMLEVILVWDREVILSLKNMTENIRKPLISLGKTQVLPEMVSLYKVCSDTIILDLDLIYFDNYSRSSLYNLLNLGNNYVEEWLI